MKLKVMGVKLYYILFHLSFLIVNVCRSQDVPLKFNYVPPPTGATFSGANGVVQDQHGFMWMGSQGLHRFDGYHYTSYYNDPLNPASLAGNRIECRFVDRKGFVWVGTMGNGLDRLDPATGIFTHYRHNPNDNQSLSSDAVTAILEDREGAIWVGTHIGLNRLDLRTKKFTRYLHDPANPNSLSHNQVRTIFQDRQGIIWVGCGDPFGGEDGKFSNTGGLNQFDQKTEAFRRYLHDSKNPQTLIDNQVQEIFEDSRGTFWIGTAGDGLHTMDRATGTITRHQHVPNQTKKLSRPPQKNVNRFTNDHITFITEDTTGAIWIGTLGNGINRYDPENQNVVHYPNPYHPFTGKQINNAWSAYTSRDGVLWIGYTDGLFRVDPLQITIPFVQTGDLTGAVYEDESGILWYSSNQGLVRKDPATGTEQRFKHEPQNPRSISHNTITYIYKDRQGVLWIGTEKGLNRFNEKEGTFTRYLSNENNNSSLINDNILSIYEDRNGLFWIGTGGGLNRMNRQTGVITHYLNNPRDPNSISSNYVECIYEDRSGNLWIGTYLGGLNKWLPETGTFKHFLYGATISSLWQDAAGILWVGTSTGFYRSNAALNDFSLFTNPTSSVGSNIIVGGILEDNHKTLWAQTSLGICRINPNRNEVIFYSSSQDQIWDSYKTFKSGKGKLFFGSGSGYYAFFPEQIKMNRLAPQIVISGLRIADQLITPGKESPLTKPLWQTKEIRLNHKQNLFSFDFAGIHYSNPEQNQHLFMLEGLDKDWHKAGEEKTAYYYNVPPGQYTFRVKAANSDGVWAEKNMAVIIYPPWWRTWWAYTLYGLLFLTAVYSVHRYQRQRLIGRERERARVKELAQAKEIEKAYTELQATQAQLIQREKMASLGELTAGIAHEIQNPLNFINNFSEVSKELVEEIKQENIKGGPEGVVTMADEVLANLDKIVHHGKRADAIVKGMLQHSRASTGNKELTDINALAGEFLRLSYQGLRAKDKYFNANLTTHFDESIGQVKVAPQDIGRVLLNIYNNAFYAVNEKKKILNGTFEPTVMVTTKRVGDKVEIYVRDNGTGIPKKVEDKIFQPFFTTKPSGQGTGLGLSLSYDIITKGHGGELSLETKEGEFTEFVIKVPIEKEM